MASIQQSPDADHTLPASRSARQAAACRPAASQALGVEHGQVGGELAQAEGGQALARRGHRGRGLGDPPAERRQRRAATVERGLGARQAGGLALSSPQRATVRREAAPPAAAARLAT